MGMDNVTVPGTLEDVWKSSADQIDVAGSWSFDQCKIKNLVRTTHP